jgi:uncharacterized protein YecT (DUF1311 family)
MKKIIIFMMISITALIAENVLKVGTYSWYGGGSTASLTVKKDSANGYGIFGEALYGMSRKFGPNIGDLSFSGFLKKGKLVYSEGKGADKYILTLKVRKDGSFDITEEGFPPFGHNVRFTGHFTSDDNPSFSCKKARTFTEKAICDNKGIARLDRKMAKAYSLLKSGFFYKEKHEDKVKSLKNEQRTWVKKRNSCKKKQAYLSCYESMYFQRLKYLDKNFDGLWDYYK